MSNKLEPTLFHLKNLKSSAEEGVSTDILSISLEVLNPSNLPEYPKSTETKIPIELESIKQASNEKLRTNSVETIALNPEHIEVIDNMLEPESSSVLTLQLGMLDTSSDPEVEELPEVVGFINRHKAQILIDSECSTYVLSSVFALKTQS